MKKRYESKSLWIAVAQGVAGILAVIYTQYPELGGVMIVKSMLDIYIRTITTQPIVSEEQM